MSRSQPGSRAASRRIARLPGAPAIVAGAAALYALIAAGSALGLDRLPILTERVTDEAGVLDAAQEAAVERVLTALQDAHGVRLYVAVLDSVGVEDPQRLAEGTAEASNLRPTDALLVVAPDGAEAMWIGEAVAGVSAGEVDAILGQRVEPPLRDGDVEEAAIAGADALGDAVMATAPDEQPPPGAAGPTPLLAALLFAGVAILAARAVWVRRDG